MSLFWKFLKIKKTALLVVLAVSSTNLLATNVAYAEFRIGIELGSGKSDLTLHHTILDSALTRDGETNNLESNNFIAGFVQYQHHMTDEMTLGIHLSFAEDSPEWRDSRVGTSADDSVKITALADNAYDVLGFVRYRWEGVQPFVMLGYSTLLINTDIIRSIDGGEEDSTVTKFEAEDWLHGWKSAIGVEVPFTDPFYGFDVFAYVALQYTDYRKENFSIPLSNGTATSQSIAYNLQESNIRFGIGYYF